MESSSAAFLLVQRIFGIPATVSRTKEEAIIVRDEIATMHVRRNVIPSGEGIL